MPSLPLDMTVLDMVSLVWFLFCWYGFQYYADKSHWRKNSLTNHVNRYRVAWMRRMLDRDNRIVDTQILGNLINGIGFFASTSILVLGGLFALLANSDLAMKALHSLPYTVQTSVTLWEFKVLLLMAVFVHAFFKFGWSFRLNNYCSIMVGGAPAPDTSEQVKDSYAIKAAQFSINGGRHFNRGLRAYFFGLAALGWFYHPIALIGISTLVVGVLYRREFSSASLFSIEQYEAENRTE